LKEEKICYKMVYSMVTRQKSRCKGSNLRRRKTDFSKKGLALKELSYFYQRIKQNIHLYNSYMRSNYGEE